MSHNYQAIIDLLTPGVLSQIRTSGRDIKYTFFEYKGGIFLRLDLVGVFNATIGIAENEEIETGTYKTLFKNRVNDCITYLIGQTAGMPDVNRLADFLRVNVRSRANGEMMMSEEEAKSLSRAICENAKYL